jgi:PAS domain-containing protein
LAFDLIRDDIGRLLNNFQPKIQSPNLLSNANRVLESGLSMTNEVTGPNGTLYFERIAPYHDSGGAIKGVMILYTDISVLLTARELQDRIDRLGIGTQLAVWEWPNTQSDSMWWSKQCFTMLGYEPDELPMLFSVWKRLLHPDDEPQIRAFGTANCPIVKNGSIRCRMRTKNGRYLSVLLRAMYGADAAEGHPRMTGSIAVVEDQPAVEGVPESI